MRRLALVCLVSGLLGLSQAEGRSEYRLGGGDGNSWTTALAEDAGGQYLVIEGDNIRRQVSVAVTPFGTGADTLLDFGGTSLQARLIDPTVNMARAKLDAGKTTIPLPYIPGSRVLSTDRCISWGNHQEILKKMLDGDPATAHFRQFTQRVGAQPGVGRFWDAATVVDFGAEVPVNRIRFYPRLSEQEDALVIEGLDEPAPALENFGEDSFLDNFVAWYEIRTGEDDFPFGSDPCNGRSQTTIRWLQHSDSALEVLQSTRENLDEVVDLRFQARSVRWITFRVFPLRDWEVAEFEVYGDGFVPKTSYMTQILDFGQPVNWSKIRWSGELPEGTRVEIRTRTGQTPDPQLYFHENLNGDLEQISKADHDRIETVVRLPAEYDVSNWSFWSPPYQFVAGLRDSSLAAEGWQDGTPLLSPGPSRYLQLHIQLFATFDATPRIDQLTLQFSESPSAQEVVGEVWPVEVETFEPTQFTYVVRPTFDAADTGFDRLEILTHTQPTVLAVLVDGEAVDLAAFTPQELDDRLVVGFPALQGEGDSFKQLEVVFETPVLRFGTEFSGWVFSADDPDQIRQGIKPGNATFRFAGDLLAVQTPVGGKLFQDVVLGPNPFTPNGDGINDQLQLSYKLREVTADRPVRVRIFDLAGRQVAELALLSSQSGSFQRRWDGRDGAGGLVPPGTYIYRLSLEAENEQEHTGLFSLVY